MYKECHNYTVWNKLLTDFIISFLVSERYMRNALDNYTTNTKYGYTDRKKETMIDSIMYSYMYSCTVASLSKGLGRVGAYKNV